MALPNMAQNRGRDLLFALQPTGLDASVDASQQDGPQRPMTPVTMSLPQLHPPEASEQQACVERSPSSRGLGRILSRLTGRTPPKPSLVTADAGPSSPSGRVRSKQPAAQALEPFGSPDASREPPAPISDDDTEPGQPDQQSSYPTSPSPALANANTALPNLASSGIQVEGGPQPKEGTSPIPLIGARSLRRPFLAPSAAQSLDGDLAFSSPVSSLPGAVHGAPAVEEEDEGGVFLDAESSEDEGKASPKAAAVRNEPQPLLYSASDGGAGSSSSQNPSEGGICGLGDIAGLLLMGERTLAALDVSPQRQDDLNCPQLLVPAEAQPAQRSPTSHACIPASPFGQLHPQPHAPTASPLPCPPTVVISRPSSIPEANIAAPSLNVTACRPQLDGGRQATFGGKEVEAAGFAAAAADPAAPSPMQLASPMALDCPATVVIVARLPEQLAPFRPDVASTTSLQGPPKMGSPGASPVRALGTFGLDPAWIQPGSVQEDPVKGSLPESDMMDLVPESREESKEERAVQEAVPQGCQLGSGGVQAVARAADLPPAVPKEDGRVEMEVDTLECGSEAAADVQPMRRQTLAGLALPDTCGAESGRQADTAPPTPALTRLNSAVDAARSAERLRPSPPTQGSPLSGPRSALRSGWREAAEFSLAAAAAASALPPPLGAPTAAPTATCAAEAWPPSSVLKNTSPAEPAPPSLPSPAPDDLAAETAPALAEPTEARSVEQAWTEGGDVCMSDAMEVQDEPFAGACPPASVSAVKLSGVPDPEPDLASCNARLTDADEGGGVVDAETLRRWMLGQGEPPEEEQECPVARAQEEAGAWADGIEEPSPTMETLEAWVNSAAAFVDEDEGYEAAEEEGRAMASPIEGRQTSPTPAPPLPSGSPQRLLPSPGLFGTSSSTPRSFRAPAAALPDAALGSPVFEPLDLNLPASFRGLDEAAEASGFAFDASMIAMEIPPLESTPSPVASQKNSPRVILQDVRDSIPLFSIRQSFVGQDSLSLDRQSLDDIAPFSRKKQAVQPALGTLLEDPDPAGAPASAAEDAQAAGGATHTWQRWPQARNAAAGSGGTILGPAARVDGKLAQVKAATPSGVGSAQRGRAGVPSLLARGASGRPTNDPTTTPLNPGGIGSSMRKAATSALKAKAATPAAHSKPQSGHGMAATTPTAPACARNPMPGLSNSTMRQQQRGQREQQLQQQRQVIGHFAPHQQQQGAVASSTSDPPPGLAADPSPTRSASSSGGQPPPDGTPLRQPSATPQPQLAASLAALLPGSWATPLAQIAALPVGAALQAPLSDGPSPFLLDGWGADETCSNIAEEARKLFSTLVVVDGKAGGGAQAVQGSGGAASSGAELGDSGSARLNAAAKALFLTRPSGPLQTPPYVPPGAAHLELLSPSQSQVYEMQIQVMVQKLADAESQQQRLEKENEALRDQLRTVEFQSVMPTEGVDDMERQARQCAEEQLALASQRLQALEEALLHLRREADELKERNAALQRRLEEERVSHSLEAEGLKARLKEAAQERDACSAEAESLAAQLSSKALECDTFQSALLSEQRRVDELQQVVRSKDAECALLQKTSTETSAKLQKALENLTTVQVSHRRQAAETESRTAALGAALTRTQQDRDSLSQELSAAQSRVKDSEAQISKMKEQLSTAGKENKELLGICNQLLSQVEKGSSS